MNLIKLAIPVLFLNGFMCEPAYAQPSAINLSNGDLVILKIDKSKQKAELRTWPKNPSESLLLQTYRVALGKEDGDKVRSGDNRTPEGIYYVKGRVATPLPFEKYGPMALELNFPNPLDHAEGKSGHGIWLHGAGDDKRIEEVRATQGCVAFYNSDIESLEHWLLPGYGIVMISKDEEPANPAADVANIQIATQTWASSWQERDLEKYMAFYSQNFVDRHGDKKSYQQYKQKIFKRYKKMQVTIENARVIVHQKYALSIFDEDFIGDKSFHAIGRKVLYWQPDPKGDWKISREEFWPTNHLPTLVVDNKLLGYFQHPNPSLESHSSNSSARTQ